MHDGRRETSNTGPIPGRMLTADSVLIDRSESRSERPDGGDVISGLRIGLFLSAALWAVLIILGHLLFQ